MEKKAGNDIPQAFKNNVTQHFNNDDLFVLGVSGGPDSMALLYLFYRYKLKALVVHINYGKRGASSDKDQELVEQMAFQWGFECCSIQADSAEKTTGNFQEWARNLRYQVFQDLKKEHQAKAVVTAHHQDDQIETVLQKILRGSSPSAWQGMSEWDEKLFRPLLDFSKQEILDFCKEEAIPYRIDESNLETDYARNFLRHDFAEKINRLFPGWQSNVLELQERGKWFQQSIDWITKEVADNFTIHLNKYSTLPEELKPAVLKNLLDRSDSSADYSKARLLELKEIENLQTGKSMDFGDFHFIRDRNRIILQKKKTTGSFEAKILKEDLPKKCPEAGIMFSCNEEPGTENKLYIDADRLKWPLMLRTWDDGDRFIPLGMKGSQKVSDHLTNRKIASHLKEKTLVLCGSDSTIYAIIYPEAGPRGEKGFISELAKCDTDTKIYLTLKKDYNR